MTKDLWSWKNHMDRCLNKTLNQMKSQAYKHVGQMGDSYVQRKFNAWHDD